MKRYLCSGLFFLATCAATATIIGFIGSENWFLDLFSHFRFQYLIILFVSTVILLVLKEKIALVFIPFIIIISVEIAPFYLNDEQARAHSNSLNILCFNVPCSNGEFNSVLGEIKQNDPDIIILQEFTELWQIMLEPNLSSYSYRNVLTREDNFGIAIYSKVEFASDSILHLSDAGIPSIAIEMNFPETTFNVLATHPLPPVGSRYFHNRNQQFRNIAKFAESVNGELLVIGDLNSSSFSNHFKNLIDESGLKDSRKGFGLLPTWPAWFSLAKTTLDHCLVSDGIMVNKRTVGNHVGSDHLPISIEIVF